jgi:hypothetical protein
MTALGEKILASAREALLVAQGDFATIKKIKVTPSCGCVFCDLGLKPAKLRRRWVHHSKRTGQIVACDAMNLKPRS